MNGIILILALFMTQMVLAATPPRREPDAAWQMRVELLHRLKDKNSSPEEEYCLNEKLKFLSYAWQVTKDRPSKEQLNASFDKVVPKCIGKVP